ncbi:MAG: PIG-L family deacetylase [Trinickia sp.]|uniref:PIG-L family deacetylase n=1 Tax=Trinickia sp. TaxID=2571163 RepID=UPI003F7E448C
MRLAGLPGDKRAHRNASAQAARPCGDDAHTQSKPTDLTAASPDETPAVGGSVSSDADDTVRANEIHPAMRALLDRHAPGWNFDSALIVLAHPDDETMMVKTISTLFAMGVKVNIVYLTQSNGGTAFTSETDIQRPKFAATGKEALYSEQYGATRIAQSFGFLADLCPDPALLKIHVLSYPDRSPYNSPAERSVRYSHIADWNRERIVEFIAGIIAEEKPAVAFSLRSEAAVHPGHSESARMLDEAIEKAKESGRDDIREPVRISAIEAGWYEQRHLRETPAALEILSRCTDEERLAIRALLAKWFGQRPAHMPPNDFEQPPGNKPQWNAEVPFEAFEAALGTDPRVIEFFRALLNEPLPVPLAELLAAKLEDEHDGQSASVSTSAGAETDGIDNVTVLAPEIPEHDDPSHERAEGVELLPAATFTSHLGPQSDSAMRALPEQVRLARAGIGTLPHEMTEKQREGLAAFQAPPPYVSDHISLGTRIRALTPEERREGHRFIAGPRRDSAHYVLSTKQMPVDVLGSDGSALTLDVHTRPFASLDSAREHAIRILKSNPDADVAIYRIEGPPRELQTSLRKRRIETELVARAAMVLDDRGTLYQTTVANTLAKYRMAPGEPYGAPPVTGMPQRKIRRAGALALGKIAATATGAYVGMRYGLHMPADTTMETMLETGRAMFGARAGINAAKRIVQIRVMQRLDELASDRERVLTRAAGAVTEVEGVSSSLERADMPALDLLERRTTGVRGLVRGYRRHDRDELAMFAEILRTTPDDVDAFRRLDTLANEGLFASESPVERARRVFWGASYAPSDIAAAGIWLAPQVMLTGFDSIEGTATWLANLATLMFVPVHLSGNGGQRLARSLEVIGNKHNFDPTVPAAGDKLRRFLPGNDERPLWVRKALGELLFYSRKRPDGGRLYKPPFFQRLPEFQMLGATIASVPFAAANALGAAHSIMTGDIASASLQMGMVAADGVFLRGFQLAHQHAHGANHGRGPIVRRGPIAAIRPPVRGAEASPVDITQPHLVADGGLLRRIDPEIVIGAGMITQVGLGLLLMS